MPSNGPRQLPAQEVAAFNRRQQSVRNQTGRRLARNQFDVDRTNLWGNLQREQLMRQFQPLRTNVQSNAAARGLINSGVFQSNLRNLLQNQLLATRGLELQLGDRLGALSLDRQDIEGTMTDQLAQIEADRLARQAMLAALIRGQQ